MESITKSHFRLLWPTLFTGDANALKFAVACLRSTGITRTDRTLILAFVGSIDSQRILGIAVLLTKGGWNFRSITEYVRHIPTRKHHVTCATGCARRLAVVKIATRTRTRARRHCGHAAPHFAGYVATTTLAL